MAGQDFVVAVGQMVAKATQWTQRSWNARSISDSVRPEKEQSADPKIFKRAPTGGDVTLLANPGCSPTDSAKLATTQRT